MDTFLHRLETALAGVLRAFGILVLPLSLLLFLQWPLREWLQAYSREANDLAQIAFALYVSLAVTEASRQDGHLAADAVARHYPLRVRRHLRRFASLLVLLPWSGFMLWSSWPEVWQAIRSMERFAETSNPGYFLVKTGVIVLALTIFVQSLIDIFDPVDSNQSP